MRDANDKTISKHCLASKQAVQAGLIHVFVKDTSVKQMR